MNIREALEYAVNLLKENNINEPIIKTRIILANILNKNKEYILIHEDEELDSSLLNRFENNIEKICSGIPVQYITNKQEFMGLEFYVDENVLIPQPDTEILVEEVIDICKNFNVHNNSYKDENNECIKILDLCTGSGAIGISIAKNIENSKITLSDISIKALEIAEKNCKNIVGPSVNNEIQIIQSDLFENINDKFDIIISNPPYIKSDVIKTLDKEVQNEPILALDGGKDGLKIYRRIIDEAYRYLKTDRCLALEIGYDQKEEVIDLIKNTKRYTDIYSKKDLAENDRIIICRKGN